MHDFVVVPKASYDERWEALAKIVAMPIKKVAFNAQVGPVLAVVVLLDFCS